MTDKQIETAITGLLNQNNATKHLPVFQRLNIMLQKSESFAFEKNIHKLITTYLENKNPELQLSALCILITCLKKGLFRSTKDLDIAYLVTDIAYTTMTDNVEHQELWLKAFSALEVMETLHKDLYMNRTLEMVKIIQKVIGSISSSLQKMSALKMLNSLVLNVKLDHDVDLLQNTLLVMWVEQICPMMFNMNQPNLQTCALEISYSSLVFLQSVFHKENERLTKFTSDIQQNYLPVMTNLVTKENCLYSKLWIFLTKLLGAKFHQGFPMVNMLLQVVEAGFKSQNIDVRIHAFYCWQSLIEGFILNPTAFFTEKRIKLLTLPLKANNGKTELLVEVKFLTWCKLFNALHIKNIDFNNVIIDQYLQFCFGPLNEQALISWSSHGTPQVSQGKKYSGLHLISCKAFLQLFGIRKYIDEELNIKLKYFNFEGPKINVADFSQYSKLIVDSVGECCVMLSQLQNSDRFECAAINEALWKSLFYSVDLLNDPNLKQTYTEEISALILALAGVARKRSSLITFGLVPLFNILTSSEFKFFKNEKITELLFIPMVQAVMKKDKALLQHDVMLIFKKIFVYKRNEKNFLKFVQMILERNSVITKENIVPEKLAMLHNIWFLLEEELKNYLHNTLKTNIDEELYTSAFCEFFVWPISTLHMNFNQEKLSTEWKELYDLYGKCTFKALQNKLAVRIMKSLKQIVDRGSHIISVAEITYFIIINLKLSDHSGENATDISEVFSLLKSFLIMENINSEPLKIFQKCVRRIFSSSRNLIYFPFCLLDPMLDCLNCLLSTHKYMDVLEDVSYFIESFKYDIIFKPGLEKLMATLKNSGVQKSLIESILLNCSLLIQNKDNNVSSSSSEVKPHKKSPNILQIKKSKATSDLEVTAHKVGRKSLFKSEESCEESTSIKSKPDDPEKQEIVSLLGHDIGTMKPVKVQGKSESPLPEAQPPKKTKPDNDSEIFVVNNPYKFNPKKLTKSQREKLSKRRDDIPAMYADLSQSQTRDFSSNSTSSLESNKTETNETKDENIPEKSSNPFLKLISKNKTDKKRETTETQSETVVKKRGRRKSVNVAKVDESPISDDKSIPILSKSSETKEITTELNSIENMKSEKSSKRRRKLNSEESETNPLNIANLEINSADLNSGDIENVPLKPEKRKRGRKPKRPKLDGNQTESEPEVGSRPAKISRGRRLSTGSIKKPQELIVTDTESLTELDIVTKQRLNRELQRIKMDIKHSEEYHKNEKRKTRMSGSFHSFLDADEIKYRKNSSPTNSPNETENASNKIVSKYVTAKNEEKLNSKESTQNSTESESVIESSQDPEPEINIKPCKIPVLYAFEEFKPGQQISLDTGTSKTDVVKGPDPTSPFKIIHTALPPKSATCKQIDFSVPSPENTETAPESIQENSTDSPKNKIEILSNIIIRTPLKEFEQFESKNSETETINSEISAEIKADNIEKTPKTIDLLARKVLFDSPTEKSDEILLSPPLKEQNTDIVTSPICTDTPTRNKELLKNTSEISPIKNLSFEEEPKISSPEIFNCEPSSSGFKLDSELERVGNNSPHPLKVYARKKNTLKPSGGRSAQMMDLISAKSTIVTSNKHKKPKEPKEPKIPENFFSPTQNRIMKMMGQLEKSEQPEHSSEEKATDEIKDEDILTFSKELPSPFASPSCSILKKRKMTEDPDDAALRSYKRRRVNFSDPPVSCRKYIEKNARIKYSASLKLDFVPQEPRVTRSSKGSDEDTENPDSVNTNSPDNDDTLTISITNTTDDKIVTNIPDKPEIPEKESSSDQNDFQILYTPKKDNSDHQKSCEVSVITKNNENSLFSESLPNAQDFLHDMPSTSRCTSESVLKWSPSKVKLCILDEEILGGTIRNVLCAILNILQEKKFDAQPLVKQLLGENSKVSNILIKNIIRFIAKQSNHSFVEILKHFESKIVCQSLLELATKSEFTELLYKQNLCEIYSSIIENPSDFVSHLPKLKLVEIGGNIIDRLDTTDMSQFLKQIYNSVPSEQYLKPVPNELLPKKEIKIEETDDQIVQNVVQRIENGSFSEDMLTTVMSAAMKKINILKSFELLYKEMQRTHSE